MSIEELEKINKIKEKKYEQNIQTNVFIIQQKSEKKYFWLANYMFRNLKKMAITEQNQNFNNNRDIKVDIKVERTEEDDGNQPNRLAVSPVIANEYYKGMIK